MDIETLLISLYPNFKLSNTALIMPDNYFSNSNFTALRDEAII